MRLDLDFRVPLGRQEEAVPANRRVSRVPGRRLWASLGVVAVLLAGTASATAGLAAAAGGPRGSLPYDPTNLPTYDHVVVIMDENLSYPALQKPGVAPYLKSLALPPVDVRGSQRSGRTVPDEIRQYTVEQLAELL